MFNRGDIVRLLADRTFLVNGGIEINLKAGATGHVTYAGGAEHPTVLVRFYAHPEDDLGFATDMNQLVPVVVDPVEPEPIEPHRLGMCEI